MRLMIVILTFACVLVVSCGGEVMPVGPQKPEIDEVALAKYQQLSLAELEAVLKELQRKESAEQAKLNKANDALGAAAVAYESADDETKPDALIKKLVLEAAAKAAENEHRAAQKELFAAKQAYVEKK